MIDEANADDILILEEEIAALEGRIENEEIDEQAALDQIAD